MIFFQALLTAKAAARFAAARKLPFQYLFPALSTYMLLLDTVTRFAGERETGLEPATSSLEGLRSTN